MGINEIQDKKLRTLAIIRIHQELKENYKKDYKYLILKIVEYIFYNNDLINAFDWSNTPEGHEFWYLVNNGKITKYYEKFYKS